MYGFDPSDPYDRRMWHYESGRPLSAAQLVALGSLDAPTAALLWLLVERHRSLIVSGPTDPTPGVGKSTTVNALLGFLPAGSSLVYTTGMFEDFSFRSEVTPETTCVLANEISDHLRIYMWGGVARRLLRLPQEGFAIATSCHADTVGDVLDMLRGDLRVAPEDVAHLGVIVNIGLTGHVWPPRRRFLAVHIADPRPADGGPAVPATEVVTARGARLLRLVTWDAARDAFDGPASEVRAVLAEALDMTAEAFEAALTRRAACVAELAQQKAGPQRMRAAAEALVDGEAG